MHDMSLHIHSKYQPKRSESKLQISRIEARNKYLPKRKDFSLPNLSAIIPKEILPKNSPKNTKLINADVCRSVNPRSPFAHIEMKASNANSYNRYHHVDLVYIPCHQPYMLFHISIRFSNERFQAESIQLFPQYFSNVLMKLLLNLLLLGLRATEKKRMKIGTLYILDEEG